MISMSYIITRNIDTLILMYIFRSKLHKQFFDDLMYNISSIKRDLDSSFDPTIGVKLILTRIRKDENKIWTVYFTYWFGAPECRWYHAQGPRRQQEDSNLVF
jgi:uncharacterized protein YodC (DUF2158 family)